jgi:hypothetical protein
MKPTSAAGASFICLLLVLLCFAIDAAAAQADQTRTPEQILKRMQELSEEARNCKDLARLQQISKELQQLGQAYQQTTGSRNTGAPSLQQAQAADLAVKEELKGREDEPCYPVLHSGALTQRLYGVQPKSRCIPVEFNLIWEIEQRAIRTDRWPTAIVAYTLEENYSGYLQMVYDPEVPSKVAAYYLVGPSPQRDNRITARITRGSAQGLLAEAYGAPTFYRTFDMSGANRFTVVPDSSRQGVGFSCEIQSNKVASLEGGFSGADIGLNPTGLIEEPYRLATRIDLSTDGTLNSVRGEIPIPELQEGLQSGHLAKTFRADYMRDYASVGMPFIDKRTGTVTLEVVFNPKIHLVVSPQDGFRSEGPDDSDQFVPGSKTYDVRNVGDIPIRFAVSKSASWLNLSSTSGELGAGEHQTVTVSINTLQALSLQSGAYTDTLSFKNLTNGSGSATRSAELRAEGEQRWEVTVKGFEVDNHLQPGAYGNKDGTSGSLHKKVRFDWRLTGRFVLRKEKGNWVYRSGEVTSVSVIPVPDFTPPDIYQCQVVKCVNPKGSISTMVGAPLVGAYLGGSVQLRWWPRRPSGCVKCSTSHPAFPKAPYEAVFTSDNFTTEIGSPVLPLKDGYSKTFSQKAWLAYTISLKRLK